MIYFFVCGYVVGSKTFKPNALDLIDEIFEKLTTFSGQITFSGLSLNSALNFFKETGKFLILAHLLIFCIYLSICRKCLWKKLMDVYLIMKFIKMRFEPPIIYLLGFITRLPVTFGSKYVKHVVIKFWLLRLSLRQWSKVVFGQPSSS